MKVWIDQDLCTGDGLCEEIAPDVFVLLDDGLAYVREGATVFADAKGNVQGSRVSPKSPAARRTSPSSRPRSAPGSASSSSLDRTPSYSSVKFAAQPADRVAWAHVSSLRSHSSCSPLAPPAR